MTLRNGLVDPNVDLNISEFPVPGAIVSRTADYVVAGNVGTVKVDASAGPVIIDLIPTQENDRQIVYVQKSDSSANAVSIRDGVTVKRILNQQGQVQPVQSDFSAATIILI